MNILEIKRKIAQIQGKGISNIVTNFYASNSNTALVQEYAEAEHSIVFTILDRNITRVYFWGLKNEIIQLLQKMPDGGVIDYISREDRYNWLEMADYEKHTIMERYINTDMREIERSEIREEVVLSLTEDIDDILRLLYKSFEPLSSHLISRKELEMAQKQNLVWIVKENCKVTSFAICKLEGKKFYLNYLYNSSCKIRGQDLLRQVISEVVRRGYTYGYLWVDSKNDSAIKLYRKLLYTPDGTKDYIYVKRKSTQ